MRKTKVTADNAAAGNAAAATGNITVLGADAAPTAHPGNSLGDTGTAPAVATGDGADAADAAGDADDTNITATSGDGTDNADDADPSDGKHTDGPSASSGGSETSIFDHAFTQDMERGLLTQPGKEVTAAGSHPLIATRGNATGTVGASAPPLPRFRRCCNFRNCRRFWCHSRLIFGMLHLIRYGREQGVR